MEENLTVAEQICSVCRWKTARRKGLCDACYMYRRNHKGKDRPESVILRHAERILENRQAAEVYLPVTALRAWPLMSAQKWKNGRI
jgi:hypothetical protein